MVDDFFMSKSHMIWYVFYMKKKSLLNTNIYLKNKKERDRLLLRTVLSSSKIEGINIPVESIIRSKKNTVKKNSPKQA